MQVVPIRGKELLLHRTPAGVDDAAKVKAEFLSNIAKGNATSPFLTREEAAEYLGTMLGGIVGLLDELRR